MGEGNFSIIDERHQHKYPKDFYLLFIKPQRKSPSWMSIPRHIIVKLLKIKGKEKNFILFVKWEEMHCIEGMVYKSDKWWLNFHNMKGRGCGDFQPRIPYSAKLSFKNEGEIKQF